MPVFDPTILDLIIAGEKAAATDALDAGHPDAFVETIGAVVENVRLIPEATSGSSHTIGTGLKLFALDQPRGWKAGLPVFIRDTADPTVNWMAGRLTVDESGVGEITVEVELVGGSGTYTSWLISAILSVATVVSPPVAVADGGTGATTEEGARSSLTVALTKPVLDVQGTPAGTPSVGDTYLVWPTGTGAWAGHDDEWAIWNGSTWDFQQPQPGNLTFSKSHDVEAFVPPESVWVYGPPWQVIGNQGLGRVIASTIGSTTTLNAPLNNWRHYSLTAASIVVTLEDPAAVEVGTVAIFTMVVAGTATINVGAGGEISGQTSVVISQWQTVRAMVVLNQFGLPIWVQW